MMIPLFHFVVFDFVGEFFTLFPIIGAFAVVVLLITMIIAGSYGFYESRHEPKATK